MHAYKIVIPQAVGPPYREREGSLDARASKCDTALSKERWIVVRIMHQQLYFADPRERGLVKILVRGIAVYLSRAASMRCCTCRISLNGYRGVWL